MTDDEQPIPWKDDDEVAAEARETAAAAETGEVFVGEFHGPDPAPHHFVPVRQADGSIRDEPVSEVAWQRYLALQRQGYRFVAKGNRRDVRAAKADARRAKRRAARQRRGPAS